MCLHRAARPARRLRILIAATLVVGCLSLGAPLTVAAALGRTVNALTGTDTGNCNATLCKTIAYALTQAAAGDTILLAGGMTYPEHDLTVPFAVTITGPNLSTTFIDAGHLGRVFSVTVGNFLPFNVVTISGVTIRNGTAGSGNNGGGILKAGPGTLALTNSSVTGNAADSGGGIYSSAGGVTLTNSTVSSNLATPTGTQVGDNEGGGGIYVVTGTLTLTGSLVSNNQATNTHLISEGGGIYDGAGTATITSSTISGNQADAAGGGWSNDTAVVTMTGVIIAHNHAEGGGGIFDFAGTVSLTTTTVSGNDAEGGGGIGNYQGETVVNASTISDNQATAYDGGGIVVGVYHTLTVTNSTISGNTATGLGGGIVSRSPSGLTMMNSTVSGNTAMHGGGISFVTDSSVYGTITDSTISGNQADAGNGDGIEGNGLVIDDTTIAFNSTGIRSDGEIELQRTIVANSTGIADCVGVITSLGNNLDGGHTCALLQSTDLAGADPLLGPLANYGGATTKSHSLLAGSPAIDRGGPSCPSPDQHGAARPQGAACDIGSYETVPPAPTLTALDVPAGIASGGTRITLTGTGFLMGASVTVGGVAATSGVVTSGTALTLTTPAGPAGPVDVTLTNPGQAPGNGSATLAAGYRYVSLSQTAGTPTGGDTVVILGLAVTAGATVLFGGTAATAVQVVNGTTLRVTTPTHPIGTVAVTVTNPGGTPVVLTGAYTYGTPTLPVAKPGGGTAGSPNTLPGTRPVGTTGGSAPNPLPPPR